MKVSDYINEAWEAVTAAGVPEELQELAFKEALTYLRQASTQPVDRLHPGLPHESSPRPSEAGNDDEDAPDLNSFLDKLSLESGADREALEHLYNVEGNVIHLRPPARQLGSNKKEKCLRIATLLVPAYVSRTGEQRVPAQAVRNECKAKNCLDQHFAANMNALRQITYGGSGNKRDFVLGGNWESFFRDAVEAVIGEPGATEDDS